MRQRHPGPDALHDESSHVSVDTSYAARVVADDAALARQAWRRGQQALIEGNTAEALRWLDRAHRLAPRDGTLTLALAAACLGRDNARAESLFRTVAEEADVREAWLGLAAARLHNGDDTGAAAALAATLARHVPEAALLTSDHSLADVIARNAGAAGWCGLTGDGRLIVRPVGAGTADIRLDGRSCAGPKLPRTWTQAHEIAVGIDGRHLLGSPIQTRSIRRATGFVEAHNGGLRGWAWYPGDPDSDPALQIQGTPDRGALRLIATDPWASLQHGVPLARPRGFSVPAGALEALPRPLRVLDRDGVDLLGSPLDPNAERDATAAAASALAGYLSASRARISPFAPPALPADAAIPAEAAGATRQRRDATVVIPIHGNPAVALACLESVLATVAPPHQVLVVDDASPEPELCHALDALAAGGRIRLLRQASNRGFPASVNAGITAATGRDVVLLNSDTLVPPGWLERLRGAAYAALEIGTATPFSNHASILSYPGPHGSNPVPDRAATLRLDAAARRANKAEVVDIPVGIGFCLYLRRDCIDAVGRFRDNVFAQGYGEESDFCLRAGHLGWRNVAVPGLFVAHLGGASFGQAGRHLQARNERLLERLHPGYGRLIAEFSRDDPLADARRRFDLVRWRAEPQGKAGSVILITHDDGGGVERQVGVSAGRHRAAGLRPIVLRPERQPDAPSAIVIDGAAAGYPNLRYSLPREMPALLRLLRGTAPRLVEIHHTLHHPPAVYELLARLGVPHEIYIHDYPWFCPQVALVGADSRYCGEPGLAGCEACVADAGRVIDEDIGIVAMRDRSAALLGAARRVVAPSEDAAVRMQAHFPGLRLQVVPQEDDSAVADPPPPSARYGRCRVCLLGAIGVHKGYDILLACARDAAARRLPLEFIVVGHTIDDARLLATGRVFITGRFKAEEAVPLIGAQDAGLALLPSVWPETWSFALTELWQAGLRVVAFDFGAPAERIRRTGRGFILPLGLPAHGINNALVAAVGLTGHEAA